MVHGKSLNPSTSTEVNNGYCMVHDKCLNPSTSTEVNNGYYDVTYLDYCASD